MSKTNEKSTTLKNANMDIAIIVLFVITAMMYMCTEERNKVVDVEDRSQEAIYFDLSDDNAKPMARGSIVVKSMRETLK